MAVPKFNILLLGHSFIRRLDEAINSTQCQQLHNNFGLAQSETQFCSQGGWKISEDYDNFISQVRSKLPTKPFPFLAAVVQIGGNDLCLKDCSPLELASKIEDFAQWLRQECSVKVVFVCELFTRPRPRGISPENYETLRSATNMYLATLLEDNIHVKFWRHRRMFRSPKYIFGHDGTHLNTLGMKKYYESLKLAIILATEKAQSL